MTNPNLTPPPVIKTEEQSMGKKPASIADRINKEKRIVAVLGVGDGGSNVSSLCFLKGGDPTFIYNTSANAVANQHHTKAIILDDTDGSGQEMRYSEEKYEEQGANSVYQLLDQYKTEIDYLFIVAAAGGGTGAGAIELMASDIIENFENKHNPLTGESYFKTLVIIMLPSHLQAGKNFYNALQVQKKLVAKDIRHIIFDNNFYAQQGASSTAIYAQINQDILTFINLYKGVLFNGSELESSIDNKDFLKILMHGRRLNFFYSKKPISANMTLDDYLLQVITNTSQPEPVLPSCYALFVKGPKETLNRLNDSIPGIKTKFGGMKENYVHLEVAENFEVALVTSGSAINEAAVIQLSAVYKDSLTARSTVSTSIFDSIDEDPFAAPVYVKPDNSKEGFVRAKRG